jgi:hypothetical protein
MIASVVDREQRVCELFASINAIVICCMIMWSQKTNIRNKWF